MFKRFNPATDIIANQEDIVTRAMFSSNVGTLTTFATSSEQTATQKTYYYEIYNTASYLPTAEAQFSVAWGHYGGSGSADAGGTVNDTPSRAIYSQYRLLCLDPDKRVFTIGGRSTSHIYVINFNRSRMKDRIDEGNIEINLRHLSGSQFIAGGGNNNAHTGSNVVVGSPLALRLIDDSNVRSATYTTAGEVYNLVSGSIEDGIYNSTNPQYYGLLFPQLGVAVIDGTKLDQSASFSTVTGSEVAGDNAYKLFVSLQGASTLTDGSGDVLGVAARSAEKVKSTHYFVRALNTEFNYSNNPSYVTGSLGTFAQPTFIKNPLSYITTIGLYNDNRELLAVAKLSKPLKKSFTQEALIKVKLDF